MMNITINKSSTIHPSKTTSDSFKQLWTSDLDLVVGRIHVVTVHFYKPNGHANIFDSNILRKALGDVLVSFYPMAGRLGRNEKGRIVINCNGEGVLFIEAETDSALDDLGNFTPSPELRRLVPTVDYSGDISSYPLFFAQVTHFRCGGVALGCGVSHVLSDGLTYFRFINTWSDVARGLSVTDRPFIDRTLLRAREPPTPIYDHVEYHKPPTVNNVVKKPGPISKSSTAILKLTPKQLSNLKTKAKSDCGLVYSSYEVLAAHIWKCVSKARGLPHDQPTKLHTAVNGRSRLSPQLPPSYLGNAIFTAATIAKSGDLISKSLSDVVKLIHTTLNKMDNDYLRSAIDYLKLQGDLSPLVRGRSYFASPNLNVNSWTSLCVYDADFGWGRPIFMGPANILYEGNIYILPSPTINDKSVSLAVCLDEHELPIFEKLLYTRLDARL
ncbi:shikimate O-hydroxycinnamoyltransferase-like [Rutidosis leptorrhynchoides]|uniref:shikimate O-hydroxycinnamoyltransferase-like n=1 Tax=Rutidosis leptorrhynchoides TaxID=125765 RepID=UPI003A9A57CC